MDNRTRAWETEDKTLRNGTRPRTPDRLKQDHLLFKEVIRFIVAVAFKYFLHLLGDFSN